MSPGLTGIRWRRVVPAAATLAGIYVLGVGVCIAVLLGVWTVNGWGDPPSVNDLIELARWLVPPAAVAFILLAVARRAGFIALWALLVCLWIFLLDSSYALQIPPRFLSWSLFALPLWIIGQLGVIRHLPSDRVRLSLGAILGIWIALAFAGSFFFAPFPSFHGGIPLLPYPAATIAAWLVWFPAPFILSAVAVHHVWRGTSALPSAPDAQE